MFLYFLLSIYHIMLLAICTTQVKKKESKNKNEKKNKVTKNLLQGDSNPDPPNTLGLKLNTSIHWTTLVSADNSSLKEVYIPSPWWLTVFKDDLGVIGVIQCKDL